MIGSATLVSTTQKASNNAAPSRARPMMVANPSGTAVPPHVVMRMITVTPAESSDVPAQSILCGTRTTGRCSTAAMANRARMPKGTLM